MDPMLAAAWVNKGTTLDDLGKYQEAVICYDKSLDINSRDTDAWTNKGNALYNLKRYQESIVCYDKSLAINPEDAIAWYDKGNALYMFGEHKEALTAYRNFVKFASPENANLVAKARKIIERIKAD
jgi:tetratricopeptide (TPR) repeat protein